MGCILNRGSLPFHPPIPGSAGAIPSKTCSIKTPPYSSLFSFFPPLLPRFFHVRRLEQFLIRSPNRFLLPSSTPLFAIPSLASPSPCCDPFFFLPPPPPSIFLRKRRIPLTRTSNQGFLRSQNPPPLIAEPKTLVSFYSFFLLTLYAKFFFFPFFAHLAISFSRCFVSFFHSPVSNFTSLTRESRVDCVNRSRWRAFHLGVVEVTIISVNRLKFGIKGKGE